MTVKAVSRQSLTVIDNRTGKSYELPIQHNSVLATDIKKIKAQSQNAPKMRRTKGCVYTTRLT